MTTVAVLADPPREGTVPRSLVERTPLSSGEIADLWAASLADVAVAVERSGGELLVNYRPNDLLPADARGDEPSETIVRAIVTAALDDADVRYEPQVGSTPSARVGNTITHLLESEGVDTAAVVPGTAAAMPRTEVDAAAMALRRHDVVLGPTPTGDVYYAGFAEPIDFEGTFEPPAVERVAKRSVAEGRSVGFVPMVPTLETVEGLCATVSSIRARRAADGWVPSATASYVEELGLRVIADSSRRRLDRDGKTDST